MLNKVIKYILLSVFVLLNIFIIIAELFYELTIGSGLIEGLLLFSCALYIIISIFERSEEKHLSYSIIGLISFAVCCFVLSGNEMFLEDHSLHSGFGLYFALCLLAYSISLCILNRNKFIYSFIVVGLSIVVLVLSLLNHAFCPTIFAFGYMSLVLMIVTIIVSIILLQTKFSSNNVTIVS